MPVSPYPTANAAALGRWLQCSEQSLRSHAEQLNRINVFPVADSDTGTNMLTTVSAIRTAVESTTHQDPADLGAVLGAGSQQAMLAARGNSGTLLAVLFSGLAEALAGQTQLHPGLLSAGLKHASQRTRQALSEPVEGTMLSVLDAACEALENVDHAPLTSTSPEADWSVVISPVLQQATAALERTEHQLPALTQAQVVDAGGAGLVLILQALATALTGQQSDGEPLAALSGLQPAAAVSAPVSGATASTATATETEVMCTVVLDPVAAMAAREHLSATTESVIMTPVSSAVDTQGRYTWRIHLHTQHPEEALEYFDATGGLLSSESTPVTEQEGTAWT